MIVFIDDEKWTIQAYIDELEQKSQKETEYKPKHYYFPKDAFDFINDNFRSIKIIILDLGLDYGDDTISFEPGGVIFYKKIKSNSNLCKIPIVIYTVSDKVTVEKYIELNNNLLTTYINRNQSDRDDVLWKHINSTIDNGHL